MTTDAPDGRADPIDAIFKSLDNSEWGRQNLPRLVSLLTHDRARVRLGAGWAITYVAEQHPDSAEYLIRRLGDRLTDDEVPLAVEQAFLGVAARYPDVVEAELPEILESGDGMRAFERGVGGSMLRADYAMGGDRNRDVGRVRFPEGDGGGDGQVFTSDERDDQWRLDLDEHGEQATTDDEENAASSDGNVGSPSRGDDDSGRSRGRPARELWAQTDHLAVISANCRFDDLAVMAQRQQGRYADVYRTRAVLDDEEIAAGLLLFHAPAERAKQYVTDLHSALNLWDIVDDVEGVRTLYDWGRQPRPWAIVEYADKDLGQRAVFSTDEALWNARHLATSLAHVHENGVVHAGIDPGNVSYHENLLDPEQRQIPMVTNVGLLSVVRNYFDPTTRLDPRYAAPEYFDRDYGRIDHASDIHGLGALCYHLFTGRPPYHGDYASIRDAILSPAPPRPSDVADVPEGLDEIVSKAMAAQKLHRYEAVTHMAADLRSLAERDGIGEIHEAYPRTPEAADTDETEGASTEGPLVDGDGLVAEERADARHDASSDSVDEIDDGERSEQAGDWDPEPAEPEEDA